MKIVFVSNYYNHHQSSISREFDEQTNHNFNFIETIPMEEERKNLGWGNDDKPHYVIQSYLNKDIMEKCKRLIIEADVVIWGSCPFEMIKPRLKLKKLTFMYSERLFKSNKFIGRILRTIKYKSKLRAYKSNHYLLCASGFAAKDYNSIGLFKNKAYKWGYFPETKTYDNINELITLKEKNTILWVARFIDWKHPEIAICLAQHLKNKGYNFKLNMIGVGPLENNIKEIIENNGLSEQVHLLGSMSPEKVREYMEKSEIFIFTSDRNEGWGAVLNEAMNSACGVVANKDIGAVPFILNNGNNGFSYSTNDQLFENVEILLNNDALRRKMGYNAFQTIVEYWNSKEAVNRFIAITDKKETNDLCNCVCEKI